MHYQMNEIEKIHNQGYFDGGYFILNPNRVNEPWKCINDFYVTLPYEHSIKKEILNLIKDTRSCLKICSFILTDKDIFGEIESILEEYEVAVFILTQLDESKFSSSLLTEEELWENVNQTHLDMIKKLYDKGAHIRATKNAHAKFVISDRKKAFVMSANVTTPSLTINPESGVYIHDINTACHLDRVFDIIFQYGTEYTEFITADSAKQFIVSRDSKISKNAFFFNGETNLRFTFNDITHSLYQSLVDTIRKAQSNIFISTYSIVGLENLPELVSAIKEKNKDGFSISIFTRGMNYRADHLYSCTQLASIGCTLYGDIFNHSKGVFTNESSILFTANIDGNHGLKNGFEVGIVLDENQAKHMEAFIKWQILSAPYKFVVSPEKKALFQQYSFYCTEKGISPIEMSKNVTIKLLKDNAFLVKDINTTPCYLKTKGRKITHIQIGKYYYEAEYRDRILFIGKKVKYSESSMDSYLFEYENIDITIE